VARKGIVTFPNFGHIGHRLSLLLRGAMPMTRALPQTRHDTANIHLFSLRDFQMLCESEGIVIEKLRCFADSGASRLILGSGFRNLGAEFVVARISKNR
jgi:methionine biosynthesis protein MetW